MLEYRSFLQKAYENSIRLKECNSLRSFSKILGMSPSTLVRVLHEKRELPLAVAHQILPKLKLDSKEADHFMASVLGSRKKLSGSRKKKVFFKYQGNLKQDKHAEVITNHDMLSILALFSSKLPRTVQTVVQKLEVSESQAEYMLKRLYLNGLIGFKNGEFFNIENGFSTSDQINSLVIKRSHLNLLDCAKSKLLTLPPELRDFTSLKIPCRLENIELAKKEIRKFQNRLFEILGAGQDSKDVVELAIQLFPQTRAGI